MSLNPIVNLPPGLVGSSPLTRGTGAADRPRTGDENVVPATGQSPVASNAAPAAAAHPVPAEAPEGTDPALWKILTSEERQFFANAGARGPLTYGYLGRSQSASQAAVSRGVRLDLKA